MPDNLTGRTTLDDAFEAILDTLSVAIVIVDAGSRIHFANRLALAMFETGEPVCAGKGELRTASATAAKALAAAIRQAANGEWPQSGHGIPLSSLGGKPAIAYVAPLSRSNPANGFTAVYVTIVQDRPPPSAEALAALYDLTPTETRVMLEIASGKNRAATAAALGIADSTVKTHLARIFAKTRTSEQAELTKLVISLSAPVVPPSQS